MKAELQTIKKMMELKNEGKFKEYLSRPVVSGYKAEITDKKVEVSADYTGFVYKYKRTIIEKEDFKEVLKQLRKLGKYNETNLRNCFNTSLKSSFSIIVRLYLYTNHV